MSSRSRVYPIVISALALGGIALIGSGLVALTNEQTRVRIAANQREQLLQGLGELVDPSRYDNALEHDTIEVINPDLLGTLRPVTLYRARRHGQPVSVLITPVAPNGYGGAIELLVAVDWDGHLAGVRVTMHRETPGLGDPIELQRSDWITTFDGRSLQQPTASGWRVKKDGGAFDQFTGATITPRAVVQAVYKTLLYYRTNRERLFVENTNMSDETGGTGDEK